METKFMEKRKPFEPSNKRSGADPSVPAAGTQTAGGRSFSCVRDDLTGVQGGTSATMAATYIACMPDTDRMGLHNKKARQSGLTPQLLQFSTRLIRENLQGHVGSVRRHRRQWRLTFDK